MTMGCPSLSAAICGASVSVRVCSSAASAKKAAVLVSSMSAASSFSWQQHQHNEQRKGLTDTNVRARTSASTSSSGLPAFFTFLNILEPKRPADLAADSAPYNRISHKTLSAFVNAVYTRGESRSQVGHSQL